jgi:hypothetical protein
MSHRAIGLLASALAGVIGFVLVVVIAHGATPNAGPRSGGWPFGSAQKMEPAIADIFGCTLEQTPRMSFCISHRTRGRAGVEIDPMHGRAVKLTAMVLVSRDDVPNRTEEQLSANTTMQLIDYLFPDWTDRRTWMSLALKQVRVRHADSTIRLGDTVLSVESEVPQGVAEQSIFAFIAVEQRVGR